MKSAVVRLGALRSPVEQLSRPNHLYRGQLGHAGVDHIIPRGGSDQGNIDNLQLLGAQGRRVKGDRSQEYLVASLRELRIAARRKRIR